MRHTIIILITEQDSEKKNDKNEIKELREYLRERKREVTILSINSCS